MACAGRLGVVTRERIDWQQMSREQAQQLVQVQADVRAEPGPSAERDHLEQQTRGTVEERARRLDIERIGNLNLPELRRKVLAKLFADQPMSALERCAADEQLARV